MKLAAKKRACITTLFHFQPRNMFQNDVSSGQWVFYLDGVSHLLQMSFILFCDNDKYCRYIAGRWREDLKSVLCVDSFWGVILHWWCSAEHETSLRWERLHISLSPGCLHLYPAQVYPSTDHSAFFSMLYSLIDSLLYLLYSLLELWTVKSNQTGRVDEVIRHSSIDYSH